MRQNRKKTDRQRRTQAKRRYDIILENVVCPVEVDVTGRVGRGIYRDMTASNRRKRRALSNKFPVNKAMKKHIRKMGC